MHTSFKNSHYFNLVPDVPQRAHILTPNKPKTSLKPLTISNYAKISLSFDEHKNLNKPTSLHRLPIAIRNSGSVSRYFWDGYELKLLSVDKNSLSISDFFFDFEDGFRKLSRICGSSIRNFFLPRVFSLNYIEYVKWKFLHRVASSSLQVLATQAMFRAIGIGYSRSLPSAAALNWVLKDGLGRLSRCIYTASLASAFDTNLKRVRFSTSIIFSLSIGIELLTPAFPNYFLLLASIANIAKQISLACYLATSTAVHRSFAIADNLGEVSAKAQIQTVCFDNLGLLLAAVLNIMFKNNQRILAGLPFLVYPIFGALDLFGIYQGLKHVHLQTLTKDRLEIIINVWIKEGYVPSPAQVSKLEGVDVFWSKSRKIWPIRIGCLDTKSRIPKLSMMMMQALKDDDVYFICIESLNHGFTRNEKNNILLCLREGSSALDVIKGLLQACYIREGLVKKWSKWEDNLKGCDGMSKEWFELMENSKELAEMNLNMLKEKMSDIGWACKNILLSTKEQIGYTFLPD